MNSFSLLSEGDALTRLVALVLLLMSVLSWVTIIYKTLLLRMAAHDLAACKAWLLQASDWAQAQAQWAASDRWHLFTGLLAAAQSTRLGALAASATPQDQLTSRLRDALHLCRKRLHLGQDWLATIGATAPFVGLLGTVWGIFHALTQLAGAANYTLDKVAQPVGEALVMTAAGLAVAIPAVMAYNLLGRRLARLDLELDGLAFDLRAMARQP
jgi:biopolymer transport protein ExbB